MNEDVSWVVTYPDGDEPGEIVEWYLTFEDALQNAKPGLLIAKEIHDKRKDYIYYTNVVKVIK